MGRRAHLHSKYTDNGVGDRISFHEALTGGQGKLSISRNEITFILYLYLICFKFDFFFVINKYIYYIFKRKH